MGHPDGDQPGHHVHAHQSRRPGDEARRPRTHRQHQFGRRHRRIAGLDSSLHRGQTAEELGQFGITVNSVAPGFVISGPRLQAYWDAEPHEAQRAHLATTFMRRVGRADDVSNAVLFLASEYASFITGQVISVNGGLR